MDFQQFLEEFVPKIQKKSKQVNQAAWILETTGSADAASLRGELETEYRLYFNDRAVFERLLAYDCIDPLLNRQLNVLIRTFKSNLINPNLLRNIVEEEAGLSLIYSNFRPDSLTENDIREILKNENEPRVRKKTWEASKQIGKVVAPSILKLVNLRNEAARSQGFSDFFSMQLKLQEVDENALFKMLDELAADSDMAYNRLIENINNALSERFSVPIEEIGPWAWSEPFCQEDPLDSRELESLVSEIDLLESARAFYREMGLEVQEILARSDNFERPGKNQHAFCIHIDREGDVRTLNNIKPTIKWLETVLHELGHAVYELGMAEDLPWLLKEPPHMITTEAMALLAGRQAYRGGSLERLVPGAPEGLKERAEESLKRRQLIFSRWVLVMTYFERELYRNPDRDLNALWWSLVERFQKIKCEGSTSGHDWAAKYHIGLAPIYYFSYLLGELLASKLEENISEFASKETGAYLTETLFKPGNRYEWSELIKKGTGSALSAKSWLKQFS